RDRPPRQSWRPAILCIRRDRPAARRPLRTHSCRIGGASRLTGDGPLKNEKAAWQGGPIPEVSLAAGKIDSDNKALLPLTQESARELQARSLRRRFAIGYCLAAELALIVWGACPR